MAEAEDQKIPSLAEHWMVPEKKLQVGQDETPVEPSQTTEKDTTNDVAPEDVTSDTTNDVSPEDVISEKSIEESPPAEESIENREKDETEDQQDPEDKPAVKLETAPADFRFPTTNQTRHCFTRYIEYHRCVAAKGEGASECDRFAKYYRALCPGEWVDRWNEQRENGSFPGPL